jgi:ribosomal protein L37E
MAHDELIFQCLVCGRVSPVVAKQPKCGSCGSGNGVTRPARDAVFSARQLEEEKEKKQ